MKLLVSSYNVDIPSLTLFDVDLNQKSYKVLDEKNLNAPSFVINNGNYIFTYSKNPIKLVSYQIENNKLVEQDELELPGKTLTHLCYSKKYNRLYAASYLDGAYLKVDVKDGMFSNLKYFNEELKPSKCHCVFLDKEEEFVNVIDIEQDRIYRYDMNLNPLKVIELPKSIGPRHGIYHHNHIYLVTEYSNEVVVLDNDGNMLQRISTINGYTEKTYGATLFVCNNMLYASNRGMETIATFKINNHLLEFNDMIPVYGMHSRHMIKTSDDTYLITFNKNSHNIVFIDILTKEKVLEIPYQNVSCGVELS